MHTFEKFIDQALWLNKQTIEVDSLYDTDELLTIEQLTELKDTNCGIRTGNIDLIRLCAEQGFPQSRLFLRCYSHSEEVLDTVWGKCFMIAACKADIIKLDQAAEKHLQPGYLETIAILLSNTPVDETIISETNMEQVASWIRFSKHLAVRGIFIDCTTEDDLCKNLHDKFSLIKKIRSDMPCLFSYFSFDGLLPSLYEGNEELLQTITMLAALNDTSLYAHFYIQ